MFVGIHIWTFGEKSQLVKTDAAIVLGAAVWGDEPSPVFRERINHAIWLYEHDYVDYIIFTGGRGEGKLLAESEVALQYAIENNVSTEHILIETTSKITEENLSYAYEIAIEKGLATFTIVSDPLHMKRSLRMAEDIGIKAYSSPTQTSVYQTLNSKVPFLFREIFYYVGYILVQPFR